MGGNGERPLITVEEAQRLVLERSKPLDAERVPIERAYGRVLAESQPLAASDVPPFASSAMDGYARAGSGHGTHGAGEPRGCRVASPPAVPPDRRLEPGEAMAISTGGVVPEGADAVIPLELARSADGRSR